MREALRAHDRLVTSSDSVPEPNLLLLGIRLATSRQEQGLSIDSLATAAGIDRKTVMRVERGLHAPSVVTLHAIAHVLDIRLGELIEELCGAHPRPGGLGVRDRWAPS